MNGGGVDPPLFLEAYNKLGDEMTIGIYKITCKETGRCYIGQSKHIEVRWKTHQKKRFPPQDFDYEILITCPIADLNELEVLMIKTFDSHANGYNKTIGGTSIKSTHADAETRAKISASLTGIKLTDEHKAKLSAAKKGKKLGPQTAEHRKKLSKPKTAEHRAKLSKPKTAEHRANMSKPRTDETKAKISAAMKNASKLQCPHCLKMFAACNLKRWHGDNCKMKELFELTNSI